MRLLLVLVAVSSTQSTKLPFCTQGVVYKDDSGSWNSSLTQGSDRYTCYFRIYYTVDNLTDCSLPEVTVVANFVKKATVQNKTGECFYDRVFVSNRRYLQCQCEEDGCNSHIQKIRPMFDTFRHQLNSENSTIEEELLLCIEGRLDRLGLFPPPPSEVLLTIQSFRWEALLICLMGGSVLLLLLVLLCRKCCCPWPKKVRYERWNVFDPEESGVCLPSASQEDIQ